MARRPGRVNRSLTRKSSTREPKRRILIVCEGEKTEVQYIEGLARHLGASPRVDIDPVGLGGEPLHVVRWAIDERKSTDRAAERAKDINLRYDEVWCLVDVDEHERLHQALDTARSHGVGLVVSNPCFEIWLLYHFQPFVSAIDRGSLSKEKLRKHIPGYTKTLPDDFPFDQHPVAMKHARSAAPEHDTPCVKGPNPSTNTWLLVRSIEKAGFNGSSER